MSGASPSNTQRFASIFSGYTRAYGTYKDNGERENGKKDIKAETVIAAVTLDLYQAHLDGTRPLGILPLDDDQMVRWSCIDIDTYPVDHKAIIKRLDELNLPLVVCRSKSGGAHCFLFLKEQADPVSVRDYMGRCAAALGHPNAEVFPKQTTRGAGETGNWLHLPYFYAQRSQRYVITADDDELDLAAFLDLAEATAVNPADLHAPDVPAALEPLPKGHKFVLPEVIPESGTQYGGRNVTLFKYGCSLQAKGWTDEAIEAEVKSVNVERCDPPLGLKDMERIIRQVLAYPKGKPVPDWVAEMNENHAVVAEAGKARVLNTRDWDPALERRFLTHSTFADFKN